MHEVRLGVRENQLGDSSLVQPHHYHAMLTRHGRGWVADVEGGIVGFSIADLERSNVWALFVHPAFEGRGVGRRLHDVMMNWFFEKGAEKVWLSTSPATRAEHFYTCAGWRLVGLEANGESRFEMTRDDCPIHSTRA